MYIKLDVQLQSPMMIGGKTLTSNFKESKSYIPGGVLRAAFAAAIIQRCPYEHKNNWLEYQERNSCVECKNRALCRDFSNIVFPTLYPLGGRPFPLTARREKYSMNAPKTFDILRSRLSDNGRNVNESNWERQEGIHIDGKKVEVVYNLITRTAIDYSRRCAKNEALYSYYAVERRMPDENKILTQTCFSGYTYLNEEQFSGMKNIRDLYIGSGGTRGMGACSISYGEASFEDTPEQLKARVFKFNEGFPGDCLYVVLDFVTDTYLNLENMAGDDQSVTDFEDKDFMRYLETAVGLPESYTLERVFKAQEVYRGFNTAASSESKMRRRGRLLVKAGAVFVYKVAREDFNEKQLFELVRSGIGENASHGFGKIFICDSFHIKFDVLQGEDVHG